MPDNEPTVAMETLELVHVPPVGEPVSVTVLPAHTEIPGTPADPPVIVGTGFTVIFVVTKQPEARL